MLCGNHNHIQWQKFTLSHKYSCYENIIALWNCIIATVAVAFSLLNVQCNFRLHIIPRINFFAAELASVSLGPCAIKTWCMDAMMIWCYAMLYRNWFISTLSSNNLTTSLDTPAAKLQQCHSWHLPASKYLFIRTLIWKYGKTICTFDKLTLGLTFES